MDFASRHSKTVVEVVNGYKLGQDRSSAVPHTLIRLPG